MTLLGRNPRFQLHRGDCVEWLRGLEDASVDLVVTDPAYESLEKHRAIGTTTRLTAAWFDIFPNGRLEDLLVELFRVCKADAHCYVWCDQDTMHVLHGLVHGAGPASRWRWWKFLTWEKTNRDDAPSPGMGYHYRAASECIVFLEKGKRRLQDLGVCDVLRAPRVRGGYPTEKPVEVLRTLVTQSSSVGELVIDPFHGSGSTGEAALRASRDFAGCDVSESAHGIARVRLSGLGEEADSLLAARRQVGLFG